MNRRLEAGRTNSTKTRFQRGQGAAAASHCCHLTFAPRQKLVRANAYKSRLIFKKVHFKSVPLTLNFAHYFSSIDHKDGGPQYRLIHRDRCTKRHKCAFPTSARGSHEEQSEYQRLNGWYFLAVADPFLCIGMEGI